MYKFMSDRITPILKALREAVLTISGGERSQQKEWVLEDLKTIITKLERILEKARRDQWLQEEMSKLMEEDPSLKAIVDKILEEKYSGKAS